MNEKTFAKDEFIGLKVKIKECSDPEWKGKTGLILNETKNTFLIDINNQEKTIAKVARKFNPTSKCTVYTRSGKRIFQ